MFLVWVPRQPIRLKGFAVYARYSSDNQDARSIEDQIYLCREFVEREGGSVVDTYTDYAISGATRHRPGLQNLIEDARARRFDAVCAEALDRLSRDQADTATLFKTLAFLDIPIVTVSEGEIDELKVGFRGTINAVYLSDLAKKTKRGQLGRIRAGKAAGGIGYGYAMVRELDARGEPIRGERAIDPEQAAVVRRIFEDYVGGKSPRAIATALNAEGIPSPRGGQWNASTINGNKARKNGILHNELYIGYLTYNRQSFRKDPETGKRQARPNPPSEWEVVEVPELRIISDDLWERSQALKTRLAPLPMHGKRRGKRLFSGLLTCGTCGGAVTIVGPDRFGCITRREKGTCSNGKTIAASKLEGRVLDGLKERLLAPEMVEHFVTTWGRKMAELRAGETQRRAQAEKRLREVEKKLAGVIAAIEDGAYSPTLRDRLSELETEKETLAADLTAMDPPPVVDFHPHLPKVYRDKVANLQEALQADDDSRHKAAQILRSLIDRIVLIPGEQRGEIHIELHGALAALLRFARGTAPGDDKFGPEFIKAVVAGGGFGRFDNLPSVVVRL